MKINTQEIEFLIAEQCLSKTELAARCGTTYRNLWRVLRNGRCTPRTVGMIAKGLGVPVIDIVKLEEECFGPAGQDSALREAGMNIKKIRKSVGITQEELALLVGVSRSTVAMWETGGQHPLAEKLPQIADALHCTIDELFDRESGPVGQDTQ